MAFHRSCQISHMNNTLNSHSAREKNKKAINAPTDDKMKCIPVLNRNVSNSEQQSNVFIKDKTTKYKYFIIVLVSFFFINYCIVYRVCWVTTRASTEWKTCVSVASLRLVQLPPAVPKHTLSQLGTLNCL